MTERKASHSAPILGMLARVLLAASGRLPLSWAQRFGMLAGGLAWRLRTRPAKVTAFNLGLCFPDLEAAERRRLARASLRAAGCLALETAALWARPEGRLGRLAAGVEGRELLEEAVRARRGVVMLLPHLGNWESVPFLLGPDPPLTALYRPPRVAQADAILRRARRRGGVRLAATDLAGVRVLRKTLAAGGVVLVMPDQEPLKTHGVFAPFFGVPALTMTLVQRLLRSTGARPLLGWAERTADRRLRMVLRAAPPGLDDPSPEAAAAALNRGLEECVRSCPEQYQWAYKRFKTAPPGELTPYRAIWTRYERRRAARGG